MQYSVFKQRHKSNLVHKKIFVTENNQNNGTKLLDYRYVSAFATLMILSVLSVSVQSELRIFSDSVKFINEKGSKIKKIQF